MRVTVRSRRTVGAILRAIEHSYGSEADLRRRVRAHPSDVAAKVALHDVRAYRGRPPSDVIEEARSLVLPDSAVDELTVQRIHLLLALQRLGGEAAGLRALARAAGRDVKNVSGDVEALRRFGMLEVLATGPGRPSRVRLPGESIELELVRLEHDAGRGRANA
jgi:hypothetical protein